MRVGVVGAGRIGRLHVATLTDHPAVGSVAICDARPDAARDLADKFDATAVDSVDDLLAGVDAVVIAAATDAHPDLLRRGIDAGLPTFCEKPLARDLAEAASLTRAVQDAGVTVQMGFQRRFDPGFRAAAEQVASGGLGDLYLLRTNTNDPAPPTSEYVANCGGLFVDTLIHDFDLIRYVSGREVVEVSAHGQVLIDEMFAQYDDIDTAAAVLKLEDGGIAVATAARHDPVGHDVRLEVFGSRDSITAGVDARTPWRVLPDGGPPPGHAYTDFFDRFAQAYRDELSTFVDVARNGRPSPCTVVDALAAQRIATACDRSRRTGHGVRLEDVE